MVISIKGFSKLRDTHFKKNGLIFLKLQSISFLAISCQMHSVIVSDNYNHLQKILQKCCMGTLSVNKVC